MAQCRCDSGAAPFAGQLCSVARRPAPFVSFRSRLLSVRSPGGVSQRHSFRTEYPVRSRQAAVGVRAEASGQSAPAEQQQLEHAIQCLSSLVLQWKVATNWNSKLELLRHDERVQAFQRSCRAAAAILHEAERLSAKHACMILCLPAMAQEHVLLTQPTDDESMRPALLRLAEGLARVEHFFGSLGGLPWYQLRCMRFIADAALADSHDISGSTSALADTAGTEAERPVFHMPSGLDLEHDADAARRAAAQGLQSLPYMAEIYPIGGAGDRLGLIDEETGESVPTAVLPYCGRTLLEGLLRDLQAREALHWRLTGRQLTTPVALMTSDAKGNHRRITSLLQSLGWFGRGESCFRLFRQPMVPVVGAEGGRWPLAGPLAPMLKPGGHGAIWKLMLDEGVFAWLAAHRREGALVRQISNPLAGTDCTLLALSGAGYMGGKLFGFASCPRAVGAAEGMNVLAERRVPVPPEQGGGWGYEYGITNIEYTEFKRLGIQDEAQFEGSQLSVFPANTNVLYLGLKAVEGAVRAGAAGGGGAALPGLIFNGSKCVEEPDCSAAGRGPTSVPAGRLECTMQNVADSLVQRFPGQLPPGRHGDLPTFAVYNSRRKVTSSAKRRRKPGSTALAQTPDGSFRDLMANARDLLLNHCDFTSVPEVGEVQEYLDTGPGFIFLHHPALGPLWDVIGQKIRGGVLAPRAELVLEVATVAITALTVDGSLLVTATAPLGHMQTVADASGAAPAAAAPRPPPCDQTSYDSLEGLFFDDTYRPADNTHEYITSLPQASSGSFVRPEENSGQHGASAAPEQRLVYSTRCGRLRLSNVVVRNAGIEWADSSNVYWRHKVARKEAARIQLHGNAEFEATDVTLFGDCTFDVPDGHCMRVGAGADGQPCISLEPLPGGAASWDWAHDMSAHGRVCLTLRESGSSSGDAPWRAPQGSAAGRGSANSLPLPRPSGPPTCGGWWPPGSDAGVSSPPELEPSWLSSQL